MNRRFPFLLFPLLLPFLLITACVDDPKINSLSVEGRWELVRGLRNGQETGTLSGTYFQFGADGKMITNLPVGPEVSVDYEQSKSTIYQKSASPIEFLIRSLNDSSMVLGFELRGMQFELFLRRKEIAEPLPEPDTSQQSVPDTIPSDTIEG